MEGGGRAGGDEGRGRRVEEKREGWKTLFFRQGRPGRSVEGASHTRRLCRGYKREVGWGGLARRARTPFLSRAPRPRATTTPNPDSRSIVRVRRSCAEASRIRLAPIRANKRGVFHFLPLPIFFLSPFCRFSFFHFVSSCRVILLREALNQKFAEDQLTRAPAPAMLLIKNFSARRWF